MIKQKLSIIGILYFIFSLSLFFVFGEEISWGYRIFNTSLNQYFQEYNIQQETNIHNLKQFFILFNCYGFLIIGIYGTFSRWLLQSKYLSKNKAGLSVITVDLFLIPYFLLVLLMSLYASILVWIYKNPSQIVDETYIRYLFQHYPFLNFYELIELILSMGFLSFCLINWYRQKIKLLNI